MLLLRPYLEGRRFIIRTDHAALRWMLHMDGSQGRLARWRLRLAEYSYTVETRPGAGHHAADTMSRLPSTSTDTSAVPDEIPCLALPAHARGWTVPDAERAGGLPPITLEELLRAQSTDNRCLDIRKEMC